MSIATISAAEKIERCSAQMLLRYPWWASLYLNLIRVETEAVPTMAVDGTHPFYNPTFTESLTDKECTGVLLHEVGHIALLHVYRKGYREHERWNIACDKAVNALLAEANIALPEGCVPPGALGLTAEELYEAITPEEMKMFARDLLEPGSLKHADDKQMTDKDWRDCLAGSRGLMPDSIKRTITEATEPRKDWKQELAKFIHSTTKADTHTWARPSRRIAGMPGWNREIESKLVIVLDTSGSVTGPILSAFAAECRAITSLNGITAVIMSADAEVQQVIQPGEPFPTEWKGGGGTDFIPALKAAEDYEPNAIVYLTDGYGAYPKDSLYPVLWALPKPMMAPHKVPFGEIILLRELKMALRESHVVEVTVTKAGKVVRQSTWESGHALSYGVNYPLVCPKKAGESVTYSVTLRYVGEKQFAKSKAQRQKEFDKRQEREKKSAEKRKQKELEQNEAELILRRKRIMNQVELAFVKKVMGAVDFITCDECNAPATFLGLTHENPGSQVIDPDQITGAWCNQHDNQHKRPYKTTATIACNRLEFFYDGLRQIYVKDAVEFAAPLAV